MVGSAEGFGVGDGLGSGVGAPFAYTGCDVGRRDGAEGRGDGREEGIGLGQEEGMGVGGIQGGAKVSKANIRSTDTPNEALTNELE